MVAVVVAERRNYLGEQKEYAEAHEMDEELDDLAGMGRTGLFEYRQSVSHVAKFPHFYLKAKPYRCFSIYMVVW